MSQNEPNSNVCMKQYTIYQKRLSVKDYYCAQCIKAPFKNASIHYFPVMRLPDTVSINFSYACFEVLVLLVLWYNDYIRIELVSSFRTLSVTN